MGVLCGVLAGSLDRRGYTGHEMLDSLNMVHMNGRVYDPLVARFVSADPILQDPMNGQSYNRFAYVMNNPTNLIDPTGFTAKKREDDKKVTSQPDGKDCFKGCEIKRNDGSTVTVFYDPETETFTVVGGSQATIQGVVNPNGQGQSNPKKKDGTTEAARGCGMGHAATACHVEGFQQNPEGVKAVLTYLPGGGVPEIIDDFNKGDYGWVVFGLVTEIPIFKAAKPLKYYRSMSHAEYAALKANKGLTHLKGKELFVSNSKKYSEDYLGREGYDVLVEFTMKPGAKNALDSVSVMHRTPAASSGWAARGFLMFKKEGDAMNLGIQQNVHLFNPLIDSFKVIK